MMDPLEAADDRDHRPSRLDTHVLVPGAFLAQFEVLRDDVLTAKAPFGQHDGVPIVTCDHRMEVLIMGVEGSPIPVDDLPFVIEQPAQFDA